MVRHVGQAGTEGADDRRQPFVEGPGGRIDLGQAAARRLGVAGQRRHVHRGHAALLDDVFAVCRGVVWFSTNRRRFTLELSDPSLAVADLTRATIPPDFRGSKIHHAYRITCCG